MKKRNREATHRQTGPLVAASESSRPLRFDQSWTDNHWIRVSVNPRDPNFFTYRPEYVRKNLVNHSR